MLTNYKEFAMTRGLLVETGTAPVVDYVAIIHDLEKVVDGIEKQIDAVFSVAQANITSHVRTSMRNNQGTWNKLKNWWQTTWHGKDRNAIESQDIRVQLSGLITLHEQEVLDELMDIMEAGPINQALSQMAPMLQNLQMQIKQRIRSSFTTYAKKLQRLALAAGTAVPGAPATPPAPGAPTPPPASTPATPPGSSSTPTPAPGSPSSTPAPGAPTPAPTPTSTSTSTSTGGGYDPSFGSHSASTGHSGGGSHTTSTGGPGSYDPYASTSTSTPASTPASTPSSTPAPAPSSPPEPEADPDDLHAQMGRPGGIDGPGSGTSVDADADQATTNPAAEKAKRRRARREKLGSGNPPEITMAPESPGEAPEETPGEAPEETPAGAESPTTEPEAPLDPRAERRRKKQADPGTMSLKDRIKAMKASLAADADDDDDSDLPDFLDTKPKDTARSSTTKPPEEEDDSLLNYQPPSENAERSRSMGSVNAREVTQQIQDIMPQITNPGMQAIAARYGKPGREQGGSNGVEKTKFFRFVSQMLTNNPDAKKIMAIPELDMIYHDIASHVPDPENVGRIANIIPYSLAYQYDDNPNGFSNTLSDILKDHGVVNGVRTLDAKGHSKRRSARNYGKPKDLREKKPREPKAPKPPSEKKPRAPRGSKKKNESIEETKQEYLQRLREVSSVTQRARMLLDLSDLPFSEQVKAYRAAMSVTI